MKWNPERVSKIKSFVNKQWKGINYTLEIDVSKTFDKSNSVIALNILYIKEEEIYLPNISKISLNFEKQIMFLMIPNEEKEGWYYLAAKKLSALLKGKHQNIMVTFIT